MWPDNMSDLASGWQPDIYGALPATVRTQSDSVSEGKNPPRISRVFATCPTIFLNDFAICTRIGRKVSESVRGAGFIDQK
jgi:hypothetical protein